MFQALDADVDGGAVLRGALDRRVRHVPRAGQDERGVDLVADHARAVPQRGVAQLLELVAGPRPAHGVVRRAQQQGARARGEGRLDGADVQAAGAVEHRDRHHLPPGQRDDVQQRGDEEQARRRRRSQSVSRANRTRP